MQLVYTRSGNMRPWQGVLMGVIFTVVGIAILFFAVSTIKSYNEKNKTYVEITSTVVDYAYNDDGLEAIIVEYEVNGTTYRKTSNAYSSMPKSIGSEVKVKYNPSNPKDAIWTNDSTNIVMPIFGVVFTVFGIIMFAFSIKQMITHKEENAVKQENGLYNNAELVNSIENNQNIQNQNLQFTNQTTQMPNGASTTNQEAFKFEEYTNNQNNQNSNF